MKKVLIVMLALISSFGFSQNNNPKKEMKKQMVQERQNFTAEEKADLQTKRMTLHLDLTEEQQRQVYDIHLEMTKKRDIMQQENKAQKEKTNLYDKTSKHLNHRIAYKKRMKTILTEKQYETWSEKMNNHKKSRAHIKQKNKHR